MSSSLEGIRSIRGSPDREQARLHARGLQRAARGREDHRRLAHPRGAADDQARARARRARHPRASHLGRPKRGKTPRLSLEPCGARLAELLGQRGAPARGLRRRRGEEGRLRPSRRAGRACSRTSASTRRRRRTTRASPRARRARATSTSTTRSAPCTARTRACTRWRSCSATRGCGFLLEKEIAALGKLVDAPEKPYVAVLGGAKVSDKIAVVESLLEKVNALVIGGAMANTFLAAQGQVNMQASQVEADKLALARTILEKARDQEGRRARCRSTSSSPPALEATDGRGRRRRRDPRGDDGARHRARRRVAHFAKRFADAKTIFWNGPMGLFEKAAVRRGHVRRRARDGGRRARSPSSAAATARRRCTPRARTSPRR